MEQYNTSEVTQIVRHYHNFLVGVQALEGKGYPPETLNPFQITGNVVEARDFFKQNRYKTDVQLRSELGVEDLEKRLVAQGDKLRHATLGKVAF